MYVGSTHSTRKIVHTQQCHYVSKTNPKWKVYFHTLQEANMAGYTLCNYCASMGKFYYRQKFQVDAYCREHDLRIFIHDNHLYVLSKDETTWRLVLTKSCRTVFLYHENFKNIRYTRKYQPYWHRSFHYQNISSQNILTCREYIVGHDDFIEKTPVKINPIPNVLPKIKKGKKKKKLSPHSKQKRKEGIRRTLTLIENLTDDYRIPKAAQL